MNLRIKSITNSLAAAGLVALCWAQPSFAGYKSSLTTDGKGSVQASLAYFTKTNYATTADNINLPSAGVGTNTVVKTFAYTNASGAPLGTPTVCTSTVNTVYLFGYKAVARSYCSSGINAGSPELEQKLQDEGFAPLVPNPCGASYEIASGDEVIDGQRYLVVLGDATAGSAAWFRGYFFNGTPANRDDIIQNGTKLYEAVVKGPFDFGDINSPDRCKAFKLPINYTGPNLYMISDGATGSTTDLAFQNCPASVSFPSCTSPLVYPTLNTIGGCGIITKTFNPPENLLGPGNTLVTATATDGAGNVATCQFQASRPFLTFIGFDSPIGGSGGTCTVPLRYINAGNKIPIKFSTTFCGTAYRSTTPPDVIIRQIDPISCDVIATPVDHAFFQWVANQWHFNWNTVSADKGKRYRIEVELGDGSPNPYAIVQLQ